MARDLVLISAFAPGAAGAIHAYELDARTGTLEPLARTAEVEHPFALALSPDGRFLYSIHAPTFGSDDHAEIATFRLEAPTGRMELLNRESTLGTSSSNLAVDATGQTLIVTGGI